MTGRLPPGPAARHPVPDDHGRVLAVLDTWWAGSGRGLGFSLVPGDDVVDGVPVHRDHDGPGLHRVLFTLSLDGQPVGYRSRSSST